MIRWHHYHPQRSWGKVIFSEASVKNSVHRGVSRPRPRGNVRGLARGCQGPDPGGGWGVWLGGGVVSRPTPRGCPGTHLGGGGSRPTPRGESRPRPRVCIPACTEADTSSPAEGYCCKRYAYTTSYWDALFTLWFIAIAK